MNKKRLTQDLKRAIFSGLSQDSVQPDDTQEVGFRDGMASLQSLGVDGGVSFQVGSLIPVVQTSTGTFQELRNDMSSVLPSSL